MVINFPKRLKYVSCNPLVDFYTKCMLIAYNSNNIKNINVTAFVINPKDYKKLEKLVTAHIAKNYPYLPYKKKLFEAAMLLLDIGPRVSKKVEQGTVTIMEHNLYA